jgi:excisionase family DNA binding protein
MKTQQHMAAMLSCIVMLSTAEVCERLRIDRKKLARLVAQEGFPQIRVGATNRYPLNDVIAWVEAHRVTPAVAPPQADEIPDADRQEIRSRLTVQPRPKGGRRA